MRSRTILCWSFFCLLSPLSSFSYAGLQGYKIGVDAGHGGCDHGAVANNLSEKDINLNTALATQKYLEADGAKVVMSRTSDANMTAECSELTARVRFFNSESVDYVLSVHHNSGTPTANGVLAYVAPSSCSYPAKSGNLASAIVNRIVKNNGLTLMQGSAGVACPGKPGVFGWGGTIVTDTKMPSVLSEVSFITNVAEATRLRDSNYLNSNGWAIYAGLADYLGQTPLSLNSVNNQTGGTFSHFDGAGSLIDSTQDCWGCNKDEAIMQRHGDANPSTVVFQWRNDTNCHHLDIVTKPDIGEVIVQSRAWDNHFNTTAYKGRPPLSVLREAAWNIVAVTSTSPLTTPTEVFAYCKRSYESLTDSYSSKTVLTPELVSFDFDYYWTGNGSLISRAGSGTGKTEDWAVTFNSHKSLTIFQWYASDSCPRVSLSDENSNAVMLNGPENEVAIKLWDAEGWTTTSCTSLPCPVTPPQGKNNYYLIKIKTEANAVPSGYLRATCF